MGQSDKGHVVNGMPRGPRRHGSAVSGVVSSGREGGMMRRCGLRVLITAVATALASAVAFAEGDPARGEKVFKKCKACHTVEQGAEHKVGPNLHGVIGRKAGAAEGYERYSRGLKTAGFTWDEKLLDQYLRSPRKVIEDSRMAFPGLKRERDRADVIAFLVEAMK